MYYVTGREIKMKYYTYLSVEIFLEDITSKYFFQTNVTVQFYYYFSVGVYAYI